ncbi:hypothetical protein [Parasphingopyxis sp.]|uniref:hypothetical protein n=1 Tax=Parasphingopyxis sp. TaxID=1920299 RepID=UPI00262BE178|nr:hypothetical protein [Parasphingopyxis sp.]
MTITRKFRSVAWAAAVSSAALSCYLISHRVAAERNALEAVERDIQLAREDILSLNTEFQTRSRMSQIEVWNRRDLILSAPAPEQFLASEIQLASLIEGPAAEAPIQQASVAEEQDESNLIDEDVFDAPDTETGGPQIQQVAYMVPEGPDGQPTAFLDDELRGAIASEAAREDAGDAGDNADR